MAKTDLSPRKIFFTNTASGKREEFKPADPKKVLFYSCGPTVYGPLHIGNARALVVADLLYRWLLHSGYKVEFVRNYTDVDDKIIIRSKRDNISAEEVSQKYIDYCEEDIKRLQLKTPSRVVKVTESMPEIIAMIEKIIARKHAYIADGEVFFSIESFPEYGKLSNKNVEDLQAGTRVEVDAKKKNPMDFSLWKPHKPGEPFWQSPWGKGRPGWHIECSAMIDRWLGETIDLHHGGQDLIFPHHENETAQSEAAHGKPFCRYWVHHAFLTSGNEKMSKSLGNILTIREFLDKYGSEVLKFLFLSFQYRSSIPYTVETLDQSLSELERVYNAKKWALLATQAELTEVSEKAEKPWTSLIHRADKVYSQIEDEMSADMNTPGALGHLFSFIREINKAEAVASGKPGIAAPATNSRAQVAKSFLDLLGKLSTLWNVFDQDPKDAFDEIARSRKALRPATGAMISEEKIKELISERAEARKNKNFSRADEIRKELDKAGIVLVDSPAGTTWKSK